MKVHRRSFAIARAACAGLVVVAALGGCASGGAGSADPATGSERSSRDRLTQADFASQPEQTLYQAIRRLRNTWLRARGAGTSITKDAGEVQVYIDGQRMPGGVAELQRFRARDVALVEYLNSSRATTRFGVGHNAGAIMVTIG